VSEYEKMMHEDRSFRITVDTLMHADFANYFEAVPAKPAETEQEPAPKFDLGDTVVLRSGGPEMVVYKHSGDKMMCAWWDGSNYGKETFSNEMLISSEHPLGVMMVRR